MSDKCKHGVRDTETNLPYCRHCDAEAKAHSLHRPDFMCYIVNKNTSYEHEVLGIYDSIEKAREHCEKAGMSAWITEHKMNSPGIGMHI